MLIRAAVPEWWHAAKARSSTWPGMIAFSGPAPQAQLPRRAVYAGTLAHLVAMTQVLHQELASEG